MKKNILILTFTLFAILPAFSQKVDYSVVSVPEEQGINFTKVTTAGDYVAMPEVKRSSNGINWFTNRIIDLSPDGTTIGYISVRQNATNIFLKNIEKQGSSIQRTNRTGVIDFSYSPDGKNIVFSEARGKTNQIFTTDANSGYVCRQITSSDRDYTPIYSNDMKQIFFCRAEQRGLSIWSYDLDNKFLSSYFPGMNPCPVKDEDAIIIARLNAEGRGEIWKMNYATGIEECLVSDPNHSFTSPTLSPDGQWILFVGDGHANMPNGRTYYNTDLFVSKIDGTQLTQLTYHAADDISPAWSRDGKYIYFVSQRGDSEGIANVWRMSFNVK
ncbi:MAG: PD40 domain-containing protein [Muribaculaceae bacterium]|nr:PD40 domain-containing protein [Muribaculaceae bacterium]